MMRIARGVTLIEILVAVILLGVIVLGIAQIDYFSRGQLVTSDRRARLQNEVSFVLEHMSKNIGQAIRNSATDPVHVLAAGDGIRIWVDSNLDGQLGAGDREAAYWYDSNNIKYCADYDAGVGRCPASFETLTNRGVILNNPSYVFAGNYLNVSITARWIPGQDSSRDNPEIIMNTTVIMPSISTN